MFLKNLTSLRVAIKFLTLFILTLVALVVLYLVAAFFLSRILVPKEPSAQGEVEIYILSNGVHTDLVVPLKTEVFDWNSFISVADTKVPATEARYVAFGWGDKGFYLETPTWADLKVSTAFKAMFGLSSSAIHATFYQQLQENELCKKILLTKSQYSRLIRHIQQRFQLDAAGSTMPVKTDANYGTNDAFYEAKGSYNLFYTCNTWTNNGLKACGQKASWWTPFDTGILYHYRPAKKAAE